MSGHYLAELNIGRVLAPLESTVMAGFTNRINEINAIADKAPGFIWRLKTDEGNATDIALFPEDPTLIVNLSVWQDFETLSDYIFKTDHLQLMQNRHQWFEVSREPTFVMWWIPADGPMPTAQQAWQRLQHLRTEGPSSYAFPLKHRFAAPQ